MIIKILQDQTSFAGIDYSERKNEKGDSELLVAKNFGLVRENMNKQSYINYLTMIGNLNGRVKNKQFHAVISTKGKEHSFPELAEVAKKYMKEMGYGENPYLVYGHHDTENNHVHIVSSRVDKKGLRIDPSFERIRTRDFIKKELEINQGKSVEEVIAQTMKYSFNTIAQARLLIEKENYVAKEKKGGIDLIKDGRIQKHISKKSIDKNISNFILDKTTAIQKKAIFYKYSEGKSIKQFQNIMKTQFGIDIELHYAKNKNSTKNHTPYGYTIIDHKSKMVMKGSQILPLKSLLTAKERPLHKQTIYDLIGKRAPSGTFTELKSRLEGYGYELKSNGTIVDLTDGNTITKLEDFFLRKSKYNERKKQAQSFTGSYHVKESSFAQLFYIKVNDIHLGKRNLTKSEKNRYKDLLALATNLGPLEERLKKDNIQIVQAGANTYLIDHERKLAVDTQRDLGMSIEKGKIKIVLPEPSTDTTNLDKDYKPMPAMDFISMIGSLGDEGADEAKKRKRYNRYR